MVEQGVGISASAITSKAVLHSLGLGVCKECRGGHWRVPHRRWVKSDGIYKCPHCGYGIAPLSLPIENAERLHEMFGVGDPASWRTA